MSNALSRFITAQEDSYPIALAEIQSGKKRSHWMWYILPQLKGLGFSDTARFYGIENREEAKAYLEHPVLGSRLREICGELLTLSSSDPHDIFGSPDDMKLKSCATLFLLVQTSDENIFKKILDKFFGGEIDLETEKLLR